MEIRARQEKTALVVEVIGRLDAVTAPQYERQMAEAVKGARNVVADFAELEYVSSAGLRSILVAGRGVKAGGGVFAFAHVHGPVAEVFHISGFDGLFPVHASVEEALAALG